MHGAVPLLLATVHDVFCFDETMEPTSYERRSLESAVATICCLVGTLHGGHQDSTSQRSEMFEHPQRATSWALAIVQEIKNLPGVLCVSFDMCQVGMCSPMKEPIKKRTVIMTNDRWLARQLQTKQCPRDHVHRRIEGSQKGYSLSKWCQVYPPALCEILTAALQHSYDS